ncbi:MAG TPA: aminoacyl-tRNA hydrolase [Candidatus Limnocylindria bacterium]|nr:aminoacyl-tRNA hydrolase [Candidatus Limnocylindria bacterium]
MLKRLFGGQAPRADRIVVGLGNPGEQHARTRHNVGFQVAARLAKRARLEFDTKAAESRIAEGGFGTLRVAIARPHTFMNDSGRAVVKLLDRYRLEPKDLLVIFDDVDLPLGRIRVREKGGPGTHNGMRSVVAAVGEGFPRIRVGVAPPDPRAEVDRDLAEYVLTPFSPDEVATAEAMVLRAAEAAEVALRDGIQRAMVTFNAQ